jgi:prepilin-type N-terminal cleavage/methylation domain-containing protein
VRRAFTIIELLVVVAIVGLLAALTASAAQRVRLAAARTACLNNLRQIGVATLGHHEAVRKLPDGGLAYWVGPKYAGWEYQILPHLGHESLHRSPDGSVALAPYVCPLRGSRVWGTPAGRRASTDYAGNAGSDATGGNGWGMMGNGRDGAIRRNAAGYRPLRLADIKTGTSNFLLAGEKRINVGLLWRDQTDDDAGWIDGWDWDIVRWTRDVPEPDWSVGDPAVAHSGFAARHSQFGGPHAGVFLTVRCDGSAHATGYGIDPAVWAVLGSNR